MFKVSELRELWSSLLNLDNPADWIGVHGSCSGHSSACHSAALEALARNIAPQQKQPPPK